MPLPVAPTRLVASALLIASALPITAPVRAEQSSVVASDEEVLRGDPSLANIALIFNVGAGRL